MKQENFAAEALFTEGRSHTQWLPKPVPEEMLRKLYELAKWGPTSMNCQPMRLRFVVTPQAKKDLVECLYEGNRSKSESAPVIAIVGYDQAFPSALPRLFPHKADAQSYYEGKPDLVESTALRNSSLQGAYLLMAARALGLDCGPMSGFDAPAVDRAFWTGTSVRTNFLCNIGFGNHSLIKPRGPRLAFDEVCFIL